MAHRKNVLAKLRSKFEFRDDWDDFFALYRATCRSATEMEYLKNVMLLHDEISVNAFYYLDSTWLIHKKKFICAWTNKVKHFGHTVTSRVKGGHAMIKKWIAVSTGDLATVYIRLSIACEN